MQVNQQSARPGGSGEVFGSMWESTVTAMGDSSFLAFLDESGVVTEWTYADFDRAVSGVAAAFLSYGVGHSDAIHVCLRNCPAFVAVWLAASQLGAWIVPVDPTSTAGDIADQLERTRPKVGVCGQARSQTYLQGATDVSLRVVQLCETPADLDSDTGPLHGDPEIGRSAREGVSLQPREPLAVMFTSGTTSRPKGVVITQANYAYTARAMAAAAGLSAEHRWLVTLPLFHGNAQYYCFASAIAIGASVGLTPTFSASQWAAQSRILHATHASLFAAPIRMILAQTPEDSEPGTLQHVWFAQSLGTDHHVQFGRLAGTLPRQLYGMTETTAIVTYDKSPVPAADCIGTVLPGRRAELLDPTTANRVNRGVTGMIAVAGDRGLDLFAEYLDDPATTGRSFTTDSSGTTWFLTGDLAREDSSGAWTFVGRADDVIKVSGENVSLAEVEATLAQAPGVLEVAVVAEHDDIRDQVPVAYAVARNPDDPPSTTTLDQWAQDNLRPSARPRRWTLLPELPRSSVGKIRKFQINRQS